MKVLKPGKLHWTTTRTCLNIDCQAELLIDEHDVMKKTDFLFVCPECDTVNIIPVDFVLGIPDWVFKMAVINGRKN